MKISRFVLISVMVLLVSCKKHKSQTPVYSLEDYTKGTSFVDSLNDSAFFYFNKAITSSNYDPYIGMAYNRIAILQFDAGDYYGSEESAVQSLKHLEKQDATVRGWISSDYTTIGNNKLNQKLYDDAIAYYDSAIKFDDSANFKSINFNDKALAFQKKKQFDTALAIYLSILDQSKNDPKEYARISSNLAVAKWKQNPNYNPLPEFFKALEIQKRINYEWGLNASYAHLSDYYSSTIPDSSLYYAKRMYEVAQKLNSVDDQLEALEKLIRSAPSEVVKAYFLRFKQLDDSIENVRSMSRNKYAFLRYSSEKSKAETLSLQQDNERKRVRINYQRIAFGSAIILFIILLLYAINSYNKRKKRIESDSRNQIHENQLKTSKKVHDVVANGLYRVMNDIEHQDAIDKEKLLDKIEDLYEQSRDIFHERPINKIETFSETIHSLLISFATNSTRILIIGNQEELWHNILAHVRIEIERVLQELIVNMKKHSQAQNVVIKFERVDEELKIHYKDDGIGFLPTFKYGNGIRNTENRISSINGRITFDGTKGLEVNISIPISTQND